MRFKRKHFIAIALALLAICWMASPITIHSDGHPGIRIRILPIKYGLLSWQYFQDHQDEFWPGGCITSFYYAKWALIY